MATVLMGSGAGPGIFGMWTGRLDRIGLKAEERLAIRCVDYLRLAAPGDLVFVKIPNEGERSRATMAVLLAMGFQIGAPDLHFLYRGVAYYIEFKIAPRQPDPAQLDVLRRLVEAGGRCAVIWTFEEFIRQMDAWRIVPMASAA